MCKKPTVIFSVDVGMACLALPRMFATLSQLWLSDKSEVTSAVAYAFKNLLKDAVAAACDTPQLVEQHRSKLSKCFSIVESCLKYQYNAVWHQVLHVVGVMFEVCTTFLLFSMRYLFYCYSIECFTNLSWILLKHHCYFFKFKKNYTTHIVLEIRYFYTNGRWVMAKHRILWKFVHFQYLM